MRVEKHGRWIVLLLSILFLLAVLLISVPKAFSALAPITTGNKKALILAPMYEKTHHVFEPDLEASLKKAGYDVTECLGTNAKLEDFRQFSQYSVIFIFADGAAINWGSGWSCFETAIPFTRQIFSSNWKDFTAGRLIPIYVDEEEVKNLKEAPGWKVAVCSSYIAAYNNGLPNALVYASSCHIMENNAFFNSVKDKGAEAVIGWSRVALTRVPDGVWSTDDNMTIQFFNKATEPNVSVDTAYNEVKGGEQNLKLLTTYDAATNAFYLNWKEAEQVESSPAKLLASGTWNSDDPNHPWIFRGGNMYYGTIPDNGNTVSPETHESGPGVYEVIDGTHIRYVTFQDVMSNGYVAGDRSTYPWKVTEVLYVDGNRVRLPDASTLGGSLTLSRLP